MNTVFRVKPTEAEGSPTFRGAPVPPHPASSSPPARSRPGGRPCGEAHAPWNNSGCCLFLCFGLINLLDEHFLRPRIFPERFPEVRLLQHEQIGVTDGANARRAAVALLVALKHHLHIKDKLEICYSWNRKGGGWRKTSKFRNFHKFFITFYLKKICRIIFITVKFRYKFDLNAYTMEMWQNIICIFMFRKSEVLSHRKNLKVFVLLPWKN